MLIFDLEHSGGDEILILFLLKLKKRIFIFETVAHVEAILLESKNMRSQKIRLCPPQNAISARRISKIWLICIFVIDIRSMLHSLPEHKITEGIVNHISDTKGAARGG